MIVARWRKHKPRSGQAAFDFEAPHPSERRETPPPTNRTQYARAEREQVPLGAGHYGDPQNADPADRELERSSIQRRFEKFHRENPHVYLAIVSLAREWKRQQKTRVSMKHIFEHLRESAATKTRGQLWKLNNIFTAPYARLVMQREADLVGFFETRGRS